MLNIIQLTFLESSCLIQDQMSQEELEEEEEKKLKEFFLLNYENQSQQYKDQSLLLQFPSTQKKIDLFHKRDKQ